MGLFDFLKGVGRKLNPGAESQEIKDLINRQLPGQIDSLNVSFQAGGTVKLFGAAKTQSAREKAVLLAGNHDGVEKVDDGMTVAAPLQQQAAQAQAAAPAAQPAEMYRIEKGDTLSKIAQAKYGDSNAWRELFEANREVIEDPDKIYPGQQIRVPKRTAASA